MERVRQALRGLPLRVRLVAAVVLLGALGLLASGAAAAAQLHGYLLGRVDDQLTSFIGTRIPLEARGGGPGEDRFNRVFRQYVARGTGRVVRVIPHGMDGPQVGATAPSEPTTVPALSSGEADWRVIGAVDALGNPVVLGLSLEDVDRTTERLVRLELLIGLAVLVLLGIAGYLIVRRSLRPLVQVEQTAVAIADGDLTRRVPDLDPRTEVGQLSVALNAMLGQIEGAFREREQSESAARASEERMRRFVGDASHELRTPLTSIRGFAELHRQGAVADGEELTRVIRRIEDEATRMGVLVDDLLLLARLDEQRPLERKPVDLRRLGTDAVVDLHAIAPERGIAFEDLGGEPVVDGDEARLRQVVSNLAANAVTHTPSDASITVRAGVVGGQAVLEVADTGPGLESEHAARVFERFYRADVSRTRTSGGSGLGLSIVAALVGAHGGTVEVDTAPGAGATFRVRLPLSADLSAAPVARATPAAGKSE